MQLSSQRAAKCGAHKRAPPHLEPRAGDTKVRGRWRTQLDGGKPPGVCNHGRTSAGRQLRNKSVAMNSLLGHRRVTKKELSKSTSTGWATGRAPCYVAKTSTWKNDVVDPGVPVPWRRSVVCGSKRGVGIRSRQVLVFHELQEMLTVEVDWFWVVCTNSRGTALYKLAISSPFKSIVPIGVSTYDRDTSGGQLCDEMAEPQPEATVSVSLCVLLDGGKPLGA